MNWMQRLRQEIESRYNCDAAGSVFLQRQLEHHRSRAFEFVFPEFKGRKFVPVNNEMDPGAEIYQYKIHEQVGRAEFISDWSKDLPRVDVFSREAFKKVRSLGDAYGWNFQEGRAAAFARENLPERKVRAARRAVEQKLDDVLLIGDANQDMEGLFSLTGAGSVPPTGPWASATFEDILADLHAISKKSFDDTNEIERADTLLIPTEIMGLLTTTYVGNEFGTTVLDLFMKTDPHIQNVDMSYRLSATGGHGGGAVNRVMAYKRDPEKLEAIVPQEFEQLPTEMKGMELVTNCHARTGGVVLYYPKSVTYMDGV